MKSSGFRNKILFRHLKQLLEKSVELKADESGRLVIFSDLHMGDGSSKDDFSPNAGLLSFILDHFYYQKGFSLLLNGDIEELQRFKLKKIQAAWKDIFEIFSQFNNHGRLFKLIGNHDLDLLLEKESETGFPVHHSIRIKWKNDYIFIFHGHQASKKYLKYNRLLGITLKYLANPLGIRNFSVSHNSRKQYAIERRVYQFSSLNKLVSVIGHTHRPLFESLSKAERLKYRIEQLCRDFSIANGEEDKNKIRKSIKRIKKDLKKIYKKEKTGLTPGNLYDSVFNIPCLFNSGCAIGKRGITALEIEKGQISLVHWFDKKMSKKYLKNSGYDPQRFRDTTYYKMVINTESLDYIFAKIKLLA